jgi:hypothetical protein
MRKVLKNDTISVSPVSDPRSPVLDLIYVLLHTVTTYHSPMVDHLHLDLGLSVNPTTQANW